MFRNLASAKCMNQHQALKKSTVPIKLPGFQSLAEWCLIPSLILTPIISNQLTWTLGPIIGQVIGWGTILFTSVIVLSAFRGKLWPQILIMLVFIIKGLQIVFNAEGEGLWFSCYMILYGCLLCSAGASMISRRLNLVYKQIYIICLLNVVFMFIQAAGIADWSQFTATHFQNEMTTYPIAFFNATDAFDATQRRPAGLMYSNQYLSMIALFGLMLHFSRKSGRFATGTFVMCTMAVLSMAKIVFWGFILMGLFVMISGNSYQRRSILRGFALMISLICLYAVLFPGLFESNINTAQLIYGFSTRISSILYEYGADNALMMLQDIEKASRGDVRVTLLYPEYEERISGYVDLIRILPYVIASILTILPFYLWGFLKLRARFPDLTTMTAMGMIIALLIPSMGSLWAGPTYLFICSFALFPLFGLLQQRHFKRLERAKIGTP